ncbi:hypothetical protein [Ensifer adhaerens]|uniref:hypothetical protein n=1 Tax=Ensifer adhaerens TaxID=106592 RepID=UPI000CF0D107|nr:hypothetical protein [Ensifer adhaerens]
MQIYGLFSNAGVARPAASGATLGGGVGSDSKRPASTALLLGAGDESAANRAAAAKKKLDEIKEQLRMLRFFASDPETLARLAKQLAQQLGTAAQQLAGAGGDGGAASGVASASAAAATVLADAGSAQADAGAQTDAPAADGEPEPPSGPTSFAERAYREFGGDDDGSDAAAKVAAELKSVAEQLKQLLRKAEQELRTKGSGHDADQARAAGQALSAVTGNIEGAGGSAFASLSVPTSISV